MTLIKDKISIATKHIKRHPTRYHFIGTEIAIIQHFSKNMLGCGETGMLLNAGGKVNWYSHFGK